MAHRARAPCYQEAESDACCAQLIFSFLFCLGPQLTVLPTVEVGSPTSVKGI